jgi:hypothetical protein
MGSRCGPRCASLGAVVDGAPLDALSLWSSMRLWVGSLIGLRLTPSHCGRRCVSPGAVVDGARRCGLTAVLSRARCGLCRGSLWSSSGLARCGSRWVSLWSSMVSMAVSSSRTPPPRCRVPLLGPSPATASREPRPAVPIVGTPSARSRSPVPDAAKPLLRARRCRQAAVWAVHRAGLPGYEGDTPPFRFPPFRFDPPPVTR